MVKFEQVERAPRDELQRAATKEKLRVRAQRMQRAGRWQRGVVLAAIVMITLFFATTSSISLPQKLAYTPFTVNSDITRIDFLQNYAPNRNIDVSLPLYMDRKTLQGSEHTEALQQLLQTAQQQARPWYGDIHNEFVAYEYLLTYANGEQRQLKYVVYSSHDVLYDMTAQQSFVLDDAQNDVFYKLRVELQEQSIISNKWLLGLFMTYLLFAICYQFFIEKRYFLISKAEVKRLRKQGASYVFNIFTALLIALPLFWLKYWLGATNIVFVILGFITSMLLHEWWEVKLGIRRSGMVPMLFMLLQLAVIFAVWFI